MSEEHPGTPGKPGNPGAPGDPGENAEKLRVETGAPKNAGATGAASPRPRKFGGTAEQIRGSLAFYKTFAFVTGTMLLLLCVEMIFRYLFNAFFYIGGINESTGAPFSLGFGLADAAVQTPWQSAMGSLPVVSGAFNLSVAVLIVHGWCYVLYLIADFRLWSLMRWPFYRFVLIALGGVIPLLSFIMERSVHREVQQSVSSNKSALRRY